MAQTIDDLMRLMAGKLPTPSRAKRPLAAKPGLRQSPRATCGRCRCIRPCTLFVGSNRKGVCGDCAADVKGTILWAATRRFRQYAASARGDKRKRGFELTVQHFVKYWCADCHYCGVAIEGVGFDRVNNDLGYTGRNIVPCCGTCNRAKGTLPKKEFVAMALAIAKNIKRKRE